MQVEVISSVNEACSGKLQHRTAIVVDVLRATTTIAAALAAGASCVIPAETVQDAKRLIKEGDLAGGDRFCRQISGFSYGNSPGQYSGEQIAGKRVVLTTSNGTRALCKAVKAEHVIAASLLNAEACAQLALELRRDIVILCAGSHDSFALEDGLCAGLLLHNMRQLDRSGILQADDFGIAMESLYLDKANAIQETLARSQTGKKLIRLGLREDIACCSQVNVMGAVPYLSGGSLIQRFPRTFAETAAPLC
ncbi:2-phosphosulfolactate phosphatase [Paenibacillus sp. CAU 1782]